MSSSPEVQRSVTGTGQTCCVRIFIRRHLFDFESDLKKSWRRSRSISNPFRPGIPVVKFGFMGDSFEIEQLGTFRISLDGLGGVLLNEMWLRSSGRHSWSTYQKERSTARIALLSESAVVKKGNPQILS